MTKLSSILHNFLNHKKVRMTLAGIIVAVIVALIPQLEPVRKELLGIIMLLVTSFNVGQGFADGMSKGKTSSSASLLDKLGAAEVKDLIAKFTEMEDK